MALLVNDVMAEENPTHEVKLSVSATNLSLPKLKTHETRLFPYTMGNTWGLSVLADIPIVPYLHSGFFIRYLMSPKKGDIGGIVDFGTFIKPMLTFSGSLGHLSFYPLLSVGLSVTFMPLIYKDFPAEENSSNAYLRRHINVFGGLFNTNAKFGIEYFPHPQFGFFAEAGFAYWYFLHQVNEELFKPKFQFFSYHLSGILADAGVKFIF